MKRKNELRKHARFENFKTELDFELFIRDRTNKLEDLQAKERTYDFFLGTVIRGFDHLLRLKEAHNRTRPRSRILLAEVEEQYIYCRGVVGGVRSFYSKGKMIERLLILDPTYKITLMKVENLEKQIATFYDAGHQRRDKFIDTHVWVDVEDMAAIDPGKRYPLTVGVDIGFIAKVYSYKGKTTHDVRGKQVKYGLKEIVINEVGYQTYQQKVYLSKFVSLMELDFKNFELLYWNKDQERFVINERRNQKYYNLIENVEEGLSEMKFDEEFYKISSEFLFEFDPLARKALQAYAKRKKEGLFKPAGKGD